MVRAVLGLLILTAGGAWGQAPSAAAPGTEKVDLASAYYYFAMAHMYALRATNPDGRPNTENINKAIENYQAALKADPQVSPIVNEELSEIVEHGRLRPRLAGIPLPPRPPR